MTARSLLNVAMLWTISISIRIAFDVEHFARVCVHTHSIVCAPLIYLQEVDIAASSVCDAQIYKFILFDIKCTIKARRTKTVPFWVRYRWLLRVTISRDNKRLWTKVETRNAIELLCQTETKISNGTEFWWQKKLRSWRRCQFIDVTVGGLSWTEAKILLVRKNSFTEIVHLYMNDDDFAIYLLLPFVMAIIAHIRFFSQVVSKHLFRMYLAMNWNRGVKTIEVNLAQCWLIIFANTSQME